MVGAVARLVDRQRPPKERLRLAVSSLHSQQHPQMVHQSRGLFTDFGTVCMLDDHPHMRRERIEARPGSNVLRITHEARIHPCQRLDQTASALLPDKVAPCHLLHEPMNAEFLVVRIAPSQPIVSAGGKRTNEITTTNTG